MKKYIPIVLVSCIALIVWLPLLMLISGSFMPIDEIKTYFGPVLLGGSGALYRVIIRLSSVFCYVLEFY